MRPLALAFSLIIVAVGCRGDAPRSSAATDRAAPFDVAAVRTLIEAKNRQFTDAHVTGDSAFLINIFTDDAKVFGPNAPVVVGRAAIAKLNAEYVQLGIHEMRETTTAFYGSAEYLVDEGTYYMRYGAANTVEEGKYINVWKQQGGEWRIHSNIWNTNAPPPK